MKNKKINLKKSGWIMAVLILAIGAAIVLNVNYVRSLPQSVMAGEEGSLIETAAQPEGKTAAVFDPLTTEKEDSSEAANKNYGEAQLVSTSKKSSTDFFETARLNRTKTRDNALESLQKTMKDTTLSEGEKQALIEELNAEISNITVESDLETILKAKGFVDCVVLMDGDYINVTVQTVNDSLTAEEVTMVRDVILSKCHGAKAENLTVVEVK